jgi:hypothetical protein
MAILRNHLYISIPVIVISLPSFDICHGFLIVHQAITQTNIQTLDHNAKQMCTVLQVNKRLQTSLSVVVWKSELDYGFCSNSRKTSRYDNVFYLKFSIFSISSPNLCPFFNLYKCYQFNDIPQNSAYFLPKIVSKQLVHIYSLVLIVVFSGTICDGTVSR